MTDLDGTDIIYVNTKDKLSPGEGSPAKYINSFAHKSRTGNPPHGISLGSPDRIPFPHLDGRPTTLAKHF